MFAMVVGAAVILAALAWQLNWFSSDDNGAGVNKGTVGPDKAKHETAHDGTRINTFPVRVARQATQPGGTGNGAETDAEAEENGNVRGKHAVIGTAVHTSCTPSASSEKNIAANQCRGRGARYNMYGSIGTSRDMVTDPQKRGILASNVAPYPQHTDEQPQDYQDLYKAVNGRQEPILMQFLRGGSNPVRMERALAANNNGLVGVPHELSQYTGTGYSSE